MDRRYCVLNYAFSYDPMKAPPFFVRIFWERKTSDMLIINVYKLAYVFIIKRRPTIILLSFTNYFWKSGIGIALSVRFLENPSYKSGAHGILSELKNDLCFLFNKFIIEKDYIITIASIDNMIPSIDNKVDKDKQGMIL
ncbi:hypothetical protein ACFFRR_005697 [Megaselia abdita]